MDGLDEAAEPRPLQDEMRADAMAESAEAWPSQDIPSVWRRLRQSQPPTKSQIRDISIVGRH